MGGGPREMTKDTNCIVIIVKLTTNEELAVRGIGIRYVLSNMLFCYKTNTTFPIWRRSIQNVIKLESIHSVSFLQFLKICLEKDILRGNIGVD